MLPIAVARLGFSVSDRVGDMNESDFEPPITRNGSFVQSERGTKDVVF